MNDDTTDGPLFAADVLTVQGGDVTTTDAFESRVDGYVVEFETLEPEELAKVVKERDVREAVVEPLAALGADDPRTLAELCALHDLLEPSSDEDWLSLVPVLRLFRPVAEPIDGAPEQFIPVSGDHVPHLARVFTPTVVYIWLDDCPPCDVMKADLEEVFGRPQDVLPLAVYGPDYREFLTEEYEVTSGPALLFVRDGVVESRLYGAHGIEVVEIELEKLVGGL